MLGVVQCSIDSATGVEHLRKLCCLELSYCPRLEDITPLARLSDGLLELELDHCKKIPDLTFLRCLRRLRKLIVSDCGEVATLGFIKAMTDLEFLSFVGTNVLDGDMTPCFNLKYAGFMNKRHYSHTFEEVEAKIAEPAGKGSDLNDGFNSSKKGQS